MLLLRSRARALALVFCVSLASLARAELQFIPVAQLTGDEGAWPLHLSDDGKSFCGNLNGGALPLAFHYSPADGYRTLPPEALITAEFRSCSVNAISPDGSTVAGQISRMVKGARVNSSYVWSKEKGFREIKPMKGAANFFPVAITANNKFVIGESSIASRPVSSYWSRATGLRKFKAKKLPAGTISAQWASSNLHQVWFSGPDTAARVTAWTRGKTAVGYQGFAGGPGWILFADATADGLTGFGSARVAKGNEAVVFTPNGTLSRLFPEDAPFKSEVTTVTADGRFVMGTVDYSLANPNDMSIDDAWIIDRTTGEALFYESGIRPEVAPLATWGDTIGQRLSKDGDVLLCAGADPQQEQQRFFITGMRAFLESQAE